MSTTPPLAAPFVPTRAYPRLRYATPVEIQFSGRVIMGITEDIAIGGLGAQCVDLPPEAAELSLLFNLPTGMTVRTTGTVRYVLPNRFGVQFTDLPHQARVALEKYTREMLGYVRRGSRVARRLTVTLMSGHDSQEQVAETAILSRNGGRVICRARFKIGEELRLRWPDQDREAQVRVVFRQLCGSGDLTDLGFVFLEDQDFWGPGLLD